MQHVVSMMNAEFRMHDTYDYIDILSSIFYQQQIEVQSNIVLLTVMIMTACDKITLVSFNTKILYL